MSGSDNFDPAAYARDVQKVARAGRLASAPSFALCGAARGPGSNATLGPALQASICRRASTVTRFPGPLALIDMLRQPDFFTGFSVTIFPILNPDGLAKGIRENSDGIDLNRDYRSTKSAEIASHIEGLKTLGRLRCNDDAA